MSQTDLILLVVYLLSVAYVLYQAFQSLEEKTMITLVGKPEFDPEFLQDYVKLEFGFKDDQRFKFEEQPKQLEATIKNSARTATITIDWDKGSLTSFDGNDRRVIRFVDNLQSSDLSKAQVSTTIMPKGSVTVKLVPEKNFKPNAESGALEPSTPIVDVVGLREEVIANRRKRPKTEKDKAKFEKLETTYTNFMTMREPLKFSLRLPLQVTNIAEGSKKDYWGFVECFFTVSRAPLKEQIPWNPKKSKPK
ncbi:MAG: hypothetical protein IGS50_24040 [Synechococcales cyanobacterium C42_A2020_086]|jgi:hypothetical protein|nr:hypothetical protein [Synechococcales cyanobacterium C42_A2020_086]